MPLAAKTRLLLVTAAAAGLAACSEEYLDRRHSISPAAGDAVRMNIATHVIDPWPRSAADTRITFSGERMSHAVRTTYRPGRAAGGSGGGSGEGGGEKSGESAR